MQALLFDLGGTLIDRRRDRDCARWWAAQGVRVEPRAVAAAVYRADHRFMEEAPDLWHAQGPAFLRRYWATVHRMLGLPPPPADVCAAWGGSWLRHPDAVAALTLARTRGARLALVSNWDATGWDVLRGLDLLRHFEVVALSAELGREKPDPAIFLWTAARLGLPPDRCAHIGDNAWDDAEGASGAGMGAVLLHRHPEWAPLPHVPSHVPVACDLRLAVVAALRSAAALPRFAGQPA